jgi:PiT family inorganic phosphate transporter
METLRSCSRTATAVVTVAPDRSREERHDADPVSEPAERSGVRGAQPRPGRVVLVLALLTALAFAVTNGFHDAANAIAALVATRAARPGPAVLLASVGNVLGPLVLGAAVADTIAGIVVLAPAELMVVIAAGVTGALVWNVVTWLRALPSSSSHALVGGLVGSALVEGGPGAVRWWGLDGARPLGVAGVLLALLVSPIAGLLVGAAAMAGAQRALRRSTRAVQQPLRRSSWAAAGALAFSHGSNDAAKALGVVGALLIADGRLASMSELPVWTKLACSAALTLGTASGSWRLVRTIGRRIYRMRMVDGLMSTASSVLVILSASFVGAPVSTTQVVASSVAGVGAGAGRRHHVHWSIVRELAIAWLLTLPAAAVLGAVAVPIWRWLS